MYHLEKKRNGGAHRCSEHTSRKKDSARWNTVSHGVECGISTTGNGMMILSAEIEQHRVEHVESSVAFSWIRRLCQIGSADAQRHLVAMRGKKVCSVYDQGRRGSVLANEGALHQGGADCRRKIAFQNGGGFQLECLGGLAGASRWNDVPSDCLDV